MASLTRKPDCRFWIGCYTDSSGKQRQRSTRLVDRKAAVKLTETWESLYQRRLTAQQARAVIADIYHELTGENVAGETVAAYLNRWAERKKVETSESTASAYKSIVNSFLAHLGERAEKMYLDEVTATHVSTWRDTKAKGRATATANIALKILRIAFQDAVRESLLIQNVATLVSTIKRKNGDASTRRPFTLPELKRVLAAANDEWHGLILAGIYTGQRLGDLARLTWANVNLSTNDLALSTGKTDRRMVLPLAEPFSRWLEKHAGDVPDAPIFPHAHECATQQGKVSQLSREFADLLASVGLVKVRDHQRHKEGRAARHELSPLSFHALRHTATSLLKNAGVGDAVARDIIGHDTVAMSAHYTHIDDRAKREAINKLPDVTR